MTKKKLTGKQQIVVNQLIRNPSLKICAEETGISYNYIRTLHTKQHILDYLDDARARVAEKAEVDAAWVLKQQVRVYERCMQDEPVRDNEGNEIGEYRFEHSGANKALEGIGKHVDVQAFKDNVSITIESLKDLSDKELEEIASGRFKP